MKRGGAHSFSENVLKRGGARNFNAVIEKKGGARAFNQMSSKEKRAGARPFYNNFYWKRAGGRGFSNFYGLNNNNGFDKRGGGRAFFGGEGFGKGERSDFVLQRLYSPVVCLKIFYVKKYKKILVFKKSFKLLERFRKWKSNKSSWSNT